MFNDRKEAGQKLGKALEHYRGCDGIILAIPKGGVKIGYYVAEHLDIPWSIIISRKLPFPDNPEAGFGAIAEDGSTFFIADFSKRLPLAVIQKVLEEQKRELKRRIDVLRDGKPLPEITGKLVILVDDGIAMGSTMQAAVRLCRNKNASKIVVAAPVAGPAAAAELAKAADEVVILEQPPFFHAVAEVYKNWYDVSDDEVVQILRKNGYYQPNLKGKEHGRS